MRAGNATSSLLRRVLSTALVLGLVGLPSGCGDDAAGSADVVSPVDVLDVDVLDTESGGGDVEAEDVSSGDLGAADTVGPNATQVCPPGLSGCVEGNQLVCNEDGSAFELRKCDSWLVCWEGDCISCVEHEDCSDGAKCIEGECVVQPLTILTEELPPALEGLPYVTALAADGGIPPYLWAIHQGELPEGVQMDAYGVISGLPQDVGPWPMLVRASDSQGEQEIAPLTLHVVDGGLHITTTNPLALGKGGESYDVQFEAVGGTPPYFWGHSAGELPPGLILGSDGHLGGVLDSDGVFEFRIKLFDNDTPPLVAEKDFELPVSITPLEIVGSTELDLLVTKVIVLPLIFVIPSFPIPYSTNLQAIGGKKPLTWSESEFPDAVLGLIPEGGIPEGLTLHADGTLEGTVSDPSLAVEVTVPILNISLYGFFFQAQVEDAQPIPFNESALYLIPTVPIGGT